MVLHFWLLPALLILVVALWSFYLVVKYRGGTGVRTEGRTVLDKPGEEHDLPPD